MLNLATNTYAPVLVGIAPAAPTVIHELDSTLPYLDQVSLFLANSDAAAATVIVTVANGAPFAVNVPARSVLQVLDDQPFYGRQGQPSGSQITVQVTGGAGSVAAFGYFTR